MAFPQDRRAGQTAPTSGGCAGALRPHPGPDAAPQGPPWTHTGPTCLGVRCSRTLGWGASPGGHQGRRVGASGSPLQLSHHALPPRPSSPRHQEQRAASPAVRPLRQSLGSPWLTRSAASGSPASRCTQPTLKLTLAGGSETLEKRRRAQSQSPRATACAPWCQSRSRSPSEAMAEWTSSGPRGSRRFPAGSREAQGAAVTVLPQGCWGRGPRGRGPGIRRPARAEGALRGGQKGRGHLRRQVPGAGGAERGAPGASGAPGRPASPAPQAPPRLATPPPEAPPRPESAPPLWTSAPSSRAGALPPPLPARSRLRCAGENHPGPPLAPLPRPRQGSGRPLPCQVRGPRPGREAVPGASRAGAGGGRRWEGPPAGLPWAPGRRRRGGWGRGADVGRGPGPTTLGGRLSGPQPAGRGPRRSSPARVGAAP